uniref:Serpentine receptor class gamma n=1 Tax=Caenorhabditis tropicalis TaxID=1561998 RepID=A0A1I7T6I7_9PELO
MKAATKHAENFYFQKTIVILRRCYYFLSTVVLLFLIFIHSDLTTKNGSYVAPIMVILIQDHGSVSTFTMLITNNLLRKATKKLFLIPENLIRKSDQMIFERNKKKKTSGVQVLTAN